MRRQALRIRKLIGLQVLCILFIGMDVNAEVNCAEPNGENGYYITSPEVIVKHTGDQVMRYRLEDSNGKVLTGRLDSTMRSATIHQGVLKDGENVLDIWLEDEKGEVLKSSMERFKYMVDQTAPVYPLTFTKGDVIEIFAEDSVSGIVGIYYALEGQDMQYLKGNNVFFEIPKEYEGKVLAYAVDKAGNQGETSYFEIKNKKKEEISIPVKSEKKEAKDDEKPSIDLSGIPDNGISNRAIVISCGISDNQEITERRGKVIRKLIDGTEVVSEIEEWEKTEEGYEFEKKLAADGIYQIEIAGEDAAGNRVEIKRQLIVDTEAPSILKVSTLEGRRMREFVWNYKMDEVISDLTSWNAEIRLNGVLYKRGQVCKEPGKYIFTITARDLAGNVRKEAATFHIYEEKSEEKTEEDVFFVKEEAAFGEEKELEKFILLFVIGCLLLGIICVIGNKVKKVHSLR